MSFGLSVMSASEVESVGLNLIDQRGARNAELLGGPRAIAAVEPERLLDLQALHVCERLRHVAPVAPAPRTTPPLAQVRGEMLHADGGRALSQDHRPLHDVAHLADVARPWRREQAVERPRGGPPGGGREPRVGRYEDAGEQHQTVLTGTL